MVKSTRTSGNDRVADPGGTRPKPASTKKADQKVKSGDRNTKSKKSENRFTE